MNILRSAVGSIKWLVVTAAIYSGATQPLYLIVPISQEQVDQCLARQQSCASACATPPSCEEVSGCAAVACDAVSSATCPPDTDEENQPQRRCCSLYAAQQGVEGSRLSTDNTDGGAFALSPAAATLDIPLAVRMVDDHAFVPLGSPPISPPPSRAPPLG